MAAEFRARHSPGGELNHLYKNLLTLAMAMFVLLAIFSPFGGTPQEPNEIR